jgi:hypothetical protein
MGHEFEVLNLILPLMRVGVCKISKIRSDILYVVVTDIFPVIRVMPEMPDTGIESNK